MYNTSSTCTYKTNESNELYQQELLAVFNVSIEQLSTKIEELYHQIKENDKLQELLQHVEKKYQWANKDHCFYFLFSYDYFSYTHEYIKDILNNQSPQNHDFLCSVI
jgi:hypothetical protein